MSKNRINQSLIDAGIAPHVIAEFVKLSLSRAAKFNSQSAKTQFQISQAKLLLFHLRP